MRLRIHRGFFLSGLGLALLATFLGVFLIAAGIFTYYWITYGRMIDQRMAGHMYQTSARVFSAPDRVFDGETLSAAELVRQLQHDGYNERKVDGAPGWYSIDGGVVEIHPLAGLVFPGQERAPREFRRGRREQHQGAR